MIGEEKGSVAISGRSSHKMTGLKVNYMNEGQACLRSLTFETTPSKMDQIGSTANGLNHP